LPHATIDSPTQRLSSDGRTAGADHPGGKGMSHVRARSHRKRRALAVLSLSAVLLGGNGVASAAELSEPAVLEASSDGEPALGASAASSSATQTTQLPVVAKDQLATSTPFVALSGVGGAKSALVKIEVTKPAELVEVWAAGAPVLVVAAGGTASNSVLVPITNGGAAISATAAAAAKITVLATYPGDSTAGASQAFAKANPVFASDATDLPSGLIGNSPVKVSLIPPAEKAASNANSVFVTGFVDAPASGVLKIGDEEVRITTGIQSFSATVGLDTLGSAEVEFDAQTGSQSLRLRLDVRGFVPSPEPSAEASALPTTGASANAPSINLATLPDKTTVAGTAIVPFAVPAATTNGSSAKPTYIVTGLPAGITFDAATLQFSGTPVGTGTSVVIVTAAIPGSDPKMPVTSSIAFNWTTTTATAVSALRADATSGNIPKIVAGFENIDTIEKAQAFGSLFGVSIFVADDLTAFDCEPGDDGCADQNAIYLNSEVFGYGDSSLYSGYADFVIKHELSHVAIWRICGTWDPYITQGRAESVTDAYAIAFMNPVNPKHGEVGYQTVSPGYGATDFDVEIAAKINQGICS